jgi:glycerophosphoryl diester phosphodiesterase
VHPSFDALSALDTAAALGCAALHPHHSQVSAELVQRAHALDVAIVTWTVNDAGDLETVVEAGVDVVITDYVADILAHLGRA